MRVNILRVRSIGVAANAQTYLLGGRIWVKIKQLVRRRSGNKSFFLLSIWGTSLMVEHSKSSLVLIGYVSNYQCMSGPVEEVRFLCSPPNISFRLVERQHT